MNEQTNICIILLTKALTGANDQKRQCLQTTTGGGGLAWADKRHGWEIFHLLVSSIAMSGARGRYYRNLETHGIT